MKTIHTTTIVARCPEGCADVYEASFEVNGATVLRVEDIQFAIDRLTQEPLFQEDLTRKLADKLECKVTTTGRHLRFGTVCTAHPKE